MRARILASFLDDEHRKVVDARRCHLRPFMIMLDNTIVNVALPSIQRDLHIRHVSQLEWVVTGYALTFALTVAARRRIGVSPLPVAPRLPDLDVGNVGLPPGCSRGFQRQGDLTE